MGIDWEREWEKERKKEWMSEWEGDRNDYVRWRVRDKKKDWIKEKERIEAGFNKMWSTWSPCCSTSSRNNIFNSLSRVLASLYYYKS